MNKMSFYNLLSTFIANQQVQLLLQDYNHKKCIFDTPKVLTVRIGHVLFHHDSKPSPGSEIQPCKQDLKQYNIYENILR